MVILFFDDFETGDGSKWDNEYGTPSYNIIYAKNGNFGMKCDSDSSGAGDYLDKTNLAWGSQTHLIASFWFQIKQNFAAYDILSLFVVNEVGVGETIQISIKYEDPFGGNVLRCYTTGVSSAVFNGISINTWYFLEIDSYVGGNTTFKLTGFADQTVASTIRFWEKIEFGCIWRGIDTGVDQDVWFDDFTLRYPDPPPIPPILSGEVELRDDCDNTCILDHIIGWEERASRVMAKKKVIGRCCATPAPEEGYITMPREIRIVARMDRDGRDCIDELWDCCDWVRLYDKEGELIDYVWLEEPNYRWDTGLGCAENEKPWIVTLGLVCSST